MTHDSWSTTYKDSWSTAYEDNWTAYYKDSWRQATVMIFSYLCIPASQFENRLPKRNQEIKKSRILETKKSISLLLMLS